MLRNNMMQNHLKDNITIYVFMSTLLVTGIVFGAIIVNSMGFIQKQDLFFHLNQFFKQINGGEGVISKDVLIKSYFFHVKYLLLLFLLGLTIIGVPLIWLLIFLKGIVIGFSVGFIVNQLGWKGFLLASVSIAPQNIVIVPLYIVAGSLAMMFSLLLLHKLFSRTSSQTMMRPFLQYVMLNGLLVICAFIGSLIETFIAHETFKLLLNNYYFIKTLLI